MLGASISDRVHCLTTLETRPSRRSSEERRTETLRFGICEKEKKDRVVPNKGERLRRGEDSFYRQAGTERGRGEESRG